MGRKKKTNSSIRLTVLVSYSLLLVLVLLIMVCTAWLAARQLHRDRQIYNTSVVETCREKLDTSITNAEKLINRLVYLEPVEKLARGPGNSVHYVYYNMYSECQALYQLYGTYVTDFFIYDSRSDMVFSVYGSSRRETFFSSQSELLTRWYIEQFEDTLCSPGSEITRTAVISPLDGHPYLLVTDAVPIVCTSNEYLNVSLAIPLGEFVSSETYSVGVFLPNSGEYIISGSDGAQSSTLAQAFDSAETSGGILSAQWKGGPVYRISSRYFDFDYVVSLPSSDYDAAIAAFLTRFILAGTIFLVAACVIAYLLVRRVYKSSADLMHRIFSDDGIAVDVDSNNEFEILDDYIKKKTVQHNLTLQYSAEHSRNYLVSCLLHGKDIRQFENSMYNWEEVLGFPFETSQFVAVRIVPAVNPLEVSVSPNLHQVQETIQPALSDLFVDQYHVFICESDSSIACLLSPRKASEAGHFLFDVKTKLEYFSDSPEGRKHPLVIVVGSIAASSSAIKKSWLDTIYLMELLSEAPGIFMYTSPPAINYDPNAYPKLEALHRLKLFLSSADMGKATEVITILLSHAIEQGAPNYALRILFYDILQTLMGVASQELPNLDRVEAFTQNSLPVYVVRKDFNTMLSFLSELCCIIAEQINERDALKNTEPSKQVNAIKQYVHAHLEEESLCVASIAEHFSMSPPALSKLFSSVAGSGLHVYINKQRIERAKQLIINDPNATAAQVAAKCGFSNLRTFSRVFSIETGTSPGKYRKECE